MVGGVEELLMDVGVDRGVSKIKQGCFN